MNECMHTRGGAFTLSKKGKIYRCEKCGEEICFYGTDKLLSISLAVCLICLCYFVYMIVCVISFHTNIEIIFTEPALIFMAYAVWAESNKLFFQVYDVPGKSYVQRYDDKKRYKILIWFLSGAAVSAVPAFIIHYSTFM